MPPISDPRILHCDKAGDLYLHLQDVSHCLITSLRNILCELFWRVSLSTFQRESFPWLETFQLGEETENTWL